MKVKELFDSLDSKIENLKWSQHGKDFLLAPFYLPDKDESYVIQIYKNKLDHTIPEFEGKKIGQISFFKPKVNGFNIEKTKDYPGDIYGVVLNALKDQFKNFDVFYFTSEHQHSDDKKIIIKKTRIYEIFARRFIRSIDSNLNLYERSSHLGEEFIITKIDLSKETKEKTGFRDLLKEAISSIDFSKAPQLKKEAKCETS